METVLVMATQKLNWIDFYVCNHKTHLFAKSLRSFVEVCLAHVLAPLTLNITVHSSTTREKNGKKHTAQDVGAKKHQHQPIQGLTRNPNMRSMPL